MADVKDRRQIYPLYSKQKVNNCANNIGRDIREHHGFISSEDEKVVENWRASHTHILNTWQFILRQRIVEKSSVYFAQRLKRKNTIYDKLQRFPDMLLARMHDIAGCRLIFNNSQDMMDYIEKLHRSHGFRHVRKEGQCKNYVVEPKPSGYRGIHDVYAYQSKKGYDRSDKWNGLLVEIQYRTIYQHAWATAVEIADYLTSERVKFSQGNEDQQEFFRCASEIIARVYEDGKSCKKDLSDIQLIEEFSRLEKKTGLLEKLKKVKILTKIPRVFGHNLVIHFMIMEGKPDLKVFGFKNLSRANKHYFEMEKKYPKDDIVLVKSKDTKSILEAYKNYFADAKDFTGYIEEGIKKLSTQPPKSN